VRAVRLASCQAGRGNAPQTTQFGDDVSVPHPFHHAAPEGRIPEERILTHFRRRAWKTLAGLREQTYTGNAE
jgi:hypothetical protein